MRGIEAEPTALALSPPGSPQRVRVCVCVHMHACERERENGFALIHSSE